MAHHVTSSDIAINGDHLDTSSIAKVKAGALAVAVAGTLVSLWLLFFAPEKFRGSYAYSWLFAFYYFLTLSIGGVFWTLLHNVSNSGWGTSVRRTFENLGATYPWMILFCIPLLCPAVQQYLYEWMSIHRDASGSAIGFGAKEALHHSSNPYDHLLYVKYWFMNLPFWYIRVAFYIVGLSAVILFLRRLSTAQDTDPNPGVQRLFRARFHSTYTLIIFALTITFTGFDFVMGMDYAWFSTMWGVYLFAGSALNSMAVIILVCTWLKSRGHLKHVTTGEHFHIMGKLLFAFTVFWAYIAFSQFFLIWYANIAEETSYFIVRNRGHWNTANIALVVGHFVIPFIVLLQAWLKKNPKYLSIVAAYTLVMHALDHYIMVIPERGISLGIINIEAFGDIRTSIPGAFWGDILAFVTMGAAFLFFLLRAIGQHSLYPNRDPRILESANLSN
jgi:hypothetical protein